MYIQPLFCVLTYVFQERIRELLAKGIYVLVDTRDIGYCSFCNFRSHG